MLSEFSIHPSLAASDVKRARSWYADKLQLLPTREYDDLLEYRVGDSVLTVYDSPNAGSAKNTVAVENVPDLRAEVAGLKTRGVVFEDYDFGDWKTVDGVMTDPEGGMAAWFTDSEGNVLSLAQIKEGVAS